MLRVCLTGGIGSGKSTAAECFRKLGVPVVDADAIARRLVEPGQPAFDEIVRFFGRTVLDPEGRIDRARLRERVFADAHARKRLEAILHPRVFRRMQKAIEALDAAYCVLVIPLLAETGHRELADRVLVVEADETIRVRRLIARDGATEAQIRRIMTAQASTEQRRKIADDWIQNDGTREELEQKVAALHRKYLELAEQATAAS